MFNNSISIKEECSNAKELEEFLLNLSRDLNIDEEITLESIENYRSLLKHYILEGNQYHWLAISLFVNCKKNAKQNPISLTRLFSNLKDFHLIEFFDKLRKWINMLNLPLDLQKPILNIEHEFHISSIIFDKYFTIFEQLFICSKEKFVHFNFANLRHDFQLNQKYKQKKLNSFAIYQFIWTIYSLLKTIYPLTSNDLISSFHLLLASNLFVYRLTFKCQLFHLIQENNQELIEKFSEKNNCSLAILNCLIEEHIEKVLFENLNFNEIDENKYFDLIRQINNQYDEIVLTNCFIDQRIFIENSQKLNDFLNHLNENKNQKFIENKTPLTAQQHLTFFNSNLSSQQYLTPISQANQLIQILNEIIEKQSNLLEFVCQQTYLDDLNQRFKEYEEIFLKDFQFHSNDYSFQLNQNRFQFAKQLFFVTLQNIFLIEKKRIQIHQLNQQQIQQTFQKLILTNEFIKSLFSLCLLLVLYSYGDMKHDLYWIIQLYSLNGYSLLKMIQIFLKSTKQIHQSRQFIKYLSTIEETILSSMIFEKKSFLWNDIQTKGILSYQNLYSQIDCTLNSPSTNLIQHFHQSPNSNQMKRKLFDQQTTMTTTTNFVRTQSDNTNDQSQMNPRKLSPYTMFYKKFYRLVSQRIHLISIRLFGKTDENCYEKILWNLFLYLFENYIESLFQSRHLDQILLITFFYSFNSQLISNEHLSWNKLIQIYKTMPNANIHLTRSVFIRTIEQNQFHSNLFQQVSSSKTIDQCLTPSKPAGTIHLIDKQIFGDIKSFYEEIFLKIPSIQINIENYFQQNQLIPFPKQISFNENQSNQHSTIHCGKNLFIDYSSKQISKNLFANSNSNSNSNSIHSNENQLNSSNEILSSSIQVSSTNTVQTTTQRTFDGKFLTTISTSYQKNQQKNSTNQFHPTNQQLRFGQTFQRTFSDQFHSNANSNSNSNTNHLNSLTKKVLQIENDRQLSSVQNQL